MKNTPFTQKHIEAGAKMAAFAGYNMPISYSGINDEHHTVRNNAGVFDVSHMGEFIIKGENALDFIQSVTTNDAAKLTDGKAQYTCLTNENGGIIDDVIIYCLEANKAYMMVVNASNLEKDWAWLLKNNKQNAELSNISDKTGLLAIQGPKALEYMQTVTDLDITNLKYYHFVKGKFAGVENVIVSATGYTGSGGIEVYFEDKDDNADKIWNNIFEAGANHGMKPIGLAARDTLRLEKGFCLYGNDIDETINPYEAGLGWITKLSKEFIGKEALENQKEQGVAKKLVGIELIDRGIPRQGYKLYNGTDEEIGFITSGTQAPSLNKAIAMGYVNTDLAKEGQEVFIGIRDKKIKAVIVKMPFLK